MTDDDEPKTNAVPELIDLIDETLGHVRPAAKRRELHARFMRLYLAMWPELREEVIAAGLESILCRLGV